MASTPTPSRVYTAADLVAISGSTAKDLAARRHKGIFTEGKPRGGSKAMFYTLADLTLYCALQHLIQRGIGTKEAAPLAARLAVAALEEMQDRIRGDRTAAAKASEQAQLLMANPEHTVLPSGHTDDVEFICIFQPAMAREYQFARMKSLEDLGRFLSSTVVCSALVINPLHWLIDIYDRLERRMEDKPDAEAPPLDGYVGKIPGR